MVMLIGHSLQNSAISIVAVPTPVKGSKEAKKANGTREAKESRGATETDEGAVINACLAYPYL